MQRFLLILILLPITALAADPDFTIVIKDHHFQPAEINVPSDKRIQLLVQNNDDTEEEFDSDSLNREKIIAGNSKATIYIGPLAPGRYPFQGELHEYSAQGVVISH